MMTMMTVIIYVGLYEHDENMIALKGLGGDGLDSRTLHMFAY
jgi:hypothetical protein